MKLFIIHGEHTLDSYNRLQEYIKKARKNDWEIQYLDKDIPNIKDGILGQSLFSKERLLVLKDIKLLSTEFSKWLKTNGKRIDSNLVIYHNGLILQKIIKSLPTAEKTEEYKITKLIWGFLDSFFPGNAKNAYKLFHEITKKDAPEFVFAMLARQIRDIYWAKVDPKTMEYPSWRVGKLKNLASKYTVSELEELISELTQADINSKTSRGNISDSLDFLIAKYLE